MEKIKRIEYCYGCGVCAASCPKNVIGMKLSADGFYIPAVLNHDKCVHCGVCERVCSYLNKGLAHLPSNIDGYVAYSKDIKIQNSCSSGGVGFEIARLLMEQGYKACGVKYSSANERAEHFISETIDDFRESKGSKYLQSYSKDAFDKLHNRDKWVVFGTPCQIDSLVRWAKQRNAEANYVFVDFFCHGVPSYHLWNSYLAYNKKKYGFSKIENVKFRDKRNGHGSHSLMMSFTCENKEVASSMFKDRNLFYRLFLGNECLNKACYKDCKYKGINSSADIRIGDLWSKDYQESKMALSAVLANTSQGRWIIDQLHAHCVLEEKEMSVVCDGQMMYKMNRSKLREKVIRDLARGKSLKIIDIYISLIHRWNALSRKLFKE